MFQHAQRWSGPTATRGGCSVRQRAVATGVRDLPPAYYADMRADYARKREIFCGVLREVGLEPIVPDGAYYVLADVKSLGCETAKDAAMRLLHEAGVASVPGSASSA